MEYQGYVHPGYTSVASEFIQRIPEDKRSGAALSVYHRGESVVDIWAGCKDHEGTPWQEDTLALSFSTTKGVAATLLHVLADQGVVEYDRPVSFYWPQFHGAGKQDITVRHVLTHQSGLYNIRAMIDDAMLMTDWDQMISVLENASPTHAPGEEHGYHGLTFGWLIGEILQRATGKTFAALLKEQLADPLKLDGAYVGLPDDQMHRRALLARYQAESRAPSNQPRKKRPPNLKQRVQGQVINNVYRLAGLDARDFAGGLAPRGMGRFSFNDPRVVQSCIPAANGLFTARSLARIYAMMAEGGELDGVRVLSAARLRDISKVHSKRLDRVVPIPMHWRLGYHRVFTTGPRTPHAFGHFGFGGSGAWCDPTRRLSVGYTVNNSAGVSPFGDGRIARLNALIIRSAERIDGRRGPFTSAVAERFYDVVNR